MKKIFFISLLIIQTDVIAQQQTIPVKDNLVVENIPELSANYISQLRNYTEFRSASIIDWHPVKKEMLISTRFSNTTQLHYVKMPGGDRQQITFYEDNVGGATFEPIKGNYFIFSKDNGGNEFAQLYRYDIANKNVTLITDGKKSQNGGIEWSNKGSLIAYTSTKRNGQDRDIFIMDPLTPETEKYAFPNTGGGWGIVEWSPNDQQLLIQEGISATETRLYTIDIVTGTKTLLLPANNEKATFRGVGYNSKGTGFYMTTNLAGEFNQLAYYDLATKKTTYITTTIPWDVEMTRISPDGKLLVFTTNENGLSKLYILNTANNKFLPVSNIPIGIIGGLIFTKDSKSLGLTFSSYNQPSDVYEYSLKTKKLIRWTESELGGQDVSALNEPELISWKSFDGKMISGFYYKSTKFSGKRPVIISIHGGPEGQSRPGFQGRWNYLLNEMGISIIYPNVRGSSGYGKTFLDADNGYKREESVKDIGALIDYIQTHPDLDKDRIMITGGSYGGYMTLAVSFMYSAKIRCAMDVVGISNFVTFLNNTEAYRKDLRRVEYGDERDSDMAKFLQKISPLNHVDEIKKPLFIVQGEKDPRVPATEAIQMKDKILAKKGTCWFLMAKDEGHGFRKKDNMDFQFYAMLEFIKLYLIN